jgi:glyoxylase-like metal-dependent hydrolase (beta-lactamase superfamily II)
MKLTRMSLLFGATLLSAGVAGCDGDTGPQGPTGPEGPPGGLDPSLSASDKVVTAMGGKSVLAGLRALSLKATGTRAVLDEGYLPDDPVLPSATFEATLTWDFVSTDLLLQYKRVVAFPFPGTFTYNEYLLKGGGWRTGNDNIFGVPEGALASERWGSARRQQLLLHPEVLVRDLASGKITGTDAGVGVLGGVLHHRLEVASTVAPVTLWVEVGTGRLSKLTTTENEQLHGDVEVAAYFSDWQPVAGGVQLPRRALVTVDGITVHEELRTEVTANPTIAPTTFAVPGGGQPTLIAAEVARGERTHSFYEMFSALGIPLAGGQTTIVAAELSPGVWHLTGGSHHSLVVELADGIAVVEAPLYADRSEAVIAWIHTNFPEKPITHVVATHFHGDHSAGLRTFVAEGATVVAGDAALGLYRKVFAARKSIEPDRQATAPRPVSLRGVEPGEVYAFGGDGEGGQEVRIYTVDTVHAADMVVAVAGGVLFVSDIFSPGFPPNVATLRELRQTITDHEIAVDLIAGGHGGTATLQQLDDLIDPPQAR